MTRVIVVRRSFARGGDGWGELIDARLDLSLEPLGEGRTAPDFLEVYPLSNRRSNGRMAWSARRRPQPGAAVPFWLPSIRIRPAYYRARFVLLQRGGKEISGGRPAWHLGRDRL